MMICEQENSVLVTVDIQEKLCNAIPPRVLARVLDNGIKLLQAAGVMEIPVIATLQYPRGLGNLHQTLENHLPDTTTRIEKTSFSCYRNDEFRAALEATGRKQVCIWGMEAHICVLQTAFDLLATGYQVFIVSDSVCSQKREHYEASLLRLNEAGISISIAESVLFEWVADAEHPNFKEITRLL